MARGAADAPLPGAPPPVSLRCESPRPHFPADNGVRPGDKAVPAPPPRVETSTVFATSRRAKRRFGLGWGVRCRPSRDADDGDLERL